MKDTEDKRSVSGDLPAYLKRQPALFVRDGDSICEAPEEDYAVARRYPNWPRKGPAIDGKRLTIMVEKGTYRVGEEVRVIHVVEALEPGHEVYIMGPKRVEGEYVDGRRVTPAPPEGEDPLIPLDYDGATLPSPAVDYNYEITTYTFPKPGTHNIVWRLDPLQSNTLTIKVEADTE